MRGLPLGNRMMYWNRGRVLARLEALLAEGFTPLRYRDYVDETLERPLG